MCAIPMAESFQFDPAPPMWWVAQSVPAQRAADTPILLDDTLHLGPRSLALAKVAGYQVETVRQRDIEGLLLAGAAFSMVAAVFLIGVMGFGWRQNFLFAFAFLIFFAMVSFFEVISIRAVVLEKLTVWTHEGATIEFSCADQADMAELCGLLDAAIAAQQ